VRLRSLETSKSRRLLGRQWWHIPRSILGLRRRRSCHQMITNKSFMELLLRRLTHSTSYSMTSQRAIGSALILRFGINMLQVANADSLMQPLNMPIHGLACGGESSAICKHPGLFDMSRTRQTSLLSRFMSALYAFGEDVICKKHSVAGSADFEMARRHICWWSKRADKRNTGLRVWRTSDSRRCSWSSATRCDEWAWEEKTPWGQRQRSFVRQDWLYTSKSLEYVVLVHSSYNRHQSQALTPSNDDSTFRTQMFSTLPKLLVP